jgi:hypothetical protein
MASSFFLLSAVTDVLIALFVVPALLVVLYVWTRGRRSSQQASSSQSKADKLDTTLGEFRDMREALRPLEHERAASRRDPRKKQ